MAQTISPSMTRAIEDTYGIPRGLINKNPEAAAIIATTPCPKCGYMHGVNSCVAWAIGTPTNIPVKQGASKG